MIKLKGKEKVKKCLRRGCICVSERKEKGETEPEKSKVLPCGFVCYNTCSYFYLPQETGMRADAGIGLREIHDPTISSIRVHTHTHTHI